MARTLPIVVDAREARRRIDERDALVVDLRKPDAYAEGHVPGAVALDYAALVRGAPPVGGLLPPEDELSDLLARLGVEPGREVIAYDDEGNGRAARLVWTLDVAGHGNGAILDGGLGAWLDLGLAQERVARAPRVGAFAARLGGDALADREWILAHLGDPGVVLLDTRSPAEYRGDDVRSARGGHVPGAVNYDWVRAMDRERHRALRPGDALRDELASLGVTPDREVVAYCQTHHRSSHTYVVLRHLGFERVRGYPGAWSQWGNDPALPVAVGDLP